MVAATRSRTSNAEKSDATIITQNEVPKTSNSLPEWTDLTIPPTFTIDLSLPPAERYKLTAQHFASELRELRPLFGAIIEMWGLPLQFVEKTCRIFLRRVFSAEESAELRGIASEAEVELYYLIALNTFLDAFMGCSSGGARVKAERGDELGDRMLHFRTLDWGMDGLRKLVVKYEYVRNGQPVGSSIGYVGFVGVLTGVRKNLSISLNFRPNRNSTSLWANARFFTHLLFVLFGFRPSIASVLRKALLSETKDLPPASTKGECSSQLDGIAAKLAKVPSTAAYITLSDGDETIVLEKDQNTASIRKSNDFIVVTNHDLLHEDNPDPEPRLLTEEDLKLRAIGAAVRPAHLADFVAESTERKQKVCSLWAAATRGTGTDGVLKSVPPQRLTRWLRTYPILNECTHFACTMDPKLGDFVYVRKYSEPHDPC